MSLTLIVGTKRYSSWSMRPWVALQHSGLRFEEEIVDFSTGDWRARINARSPNGKVPLLIDGATEIFESLAICEYIAELAPDAGLWPRDRTERALARSVATEMHGGFASLRNECTMDVRARHERFAISEETRRDVARIVKIWEECRGKAPKGGPFLFGAFTIADAMYAPVVTRIRSYGLEVSQVARDYVDAMYAQPAVAAWISAGERDEGRYVGDSKFQLDRAWAESFANAWAAAWTRRDVASVLAHFADDATFASPKANAITGSTFVRGRAALEAYWKTAVASIPSLRFTVEDVTIDPAVRRLWIRYVTTSGGAPVRAAEMMELGVDGKVHHGEAMYGGPNA